MQGECRPITQQHHRVPPAEFLSGLAGSPWLSEEQLQLAEGLQGEVVRLSGQWEAASASTVQQSASAEQAAAGLQQLQRELALFRSSLHTAHTTLRQRRRRAGRQSRHSSSNDSGISDASGGIFRYVVVKIMGDIAIDIYFWFAATAGCPRRWSSCPD